MEKYYRFFRAKYNYWFGKDSIMPIWALPILIPVGIIAALLSGLEAALVVIGAAIVLPIDGILRAFSWIIEKIFLRGEK